MSVDTPAEPSIIQDADKAAAQEPMRPTIRIVPIPTETDWEQPEGYTMRELVPMIEDGRTVFYATLMKLPPKFLERAGAAQNKDAAARRFGVGGKNNKKR